MAVLGGDLTQLRRRGGRWRLRDWRLRTKLTVLLLVPLVLAGVLGALRVTQSLANARDLDAVAQQVAFVQQVGVVVHDLQQERRLAVEALVTEDSADRAALEAQTQRVDVGITTLRSADARVQAGTAGLGAAATSVYRATLDRLAELPALRSSTVSPPAVDTPAVDTPARVENVVTAYTGILAGLLDLSRTVLHGTRDELTRQIDGPAALTIAKEQVSLQHAVLLAAILSDSSDGLDAGQQATLRTAEARFDAAIDEFGDAVSSAQQQLYANTVTGDAVDNRKRLLDTALDQALRDAPLEIAPADWNLAATETMERLRRVESTLLDQSRRDTEALSDQAWNAAIRDAVVVAVLLLLAVLLLVLVVRSLLRPLRTLRTAAFDVADRRLPDAVEKLRIADDKIGETIVDPVPVFSREEVGQVARAFDTVHVQAVRLAAEQAMLRSTINDIFLNLAGRSQRLVERQLKLIDNLESAEQDPEQLSNLFQLDHLATRMRRNSENLLVLAGGELRRGTEQGVAVLDMLRAAVSEIAEYRRVRLRRPPAATIKGPVVSDLVHLIAELLDNATSAGPPDTVVIVSSALTEDGGLLVEITDCGTGLPPGELHAINERLASPPVVDVSVSRQMGLFVVGRLAARHRIRVRLRQQRGEFGIIAAVQLPSCLVCTDPTESSPAPTPEAADSPACTVPEWPVPALFEPSGAAGSGAAGSGAAGSGTVEWSVADVDLPLQISVVDGDVVDEPVSPTAIGNLTNPRLRRPPRTAEEEWLELFGRDGPEHTGPIPLPEADPSAVTGTGESVPLSDQQDDARTAPDPGPAGAGTAQDAAGPAREVAGPAQEVAGPAQELGGPVRDTAAQEVHEEIFEEVSAWFRERGSGSAGPSVASPPVVDGDVATPPSGFRSPLTPAPVQAPDWQSIADEGWRAADALRTPVDYGVTAAGLPRRRPRAHLVPGAAGTSRLTSASPPALLRTPDDVRGRLSSYQRGLQYGRHARFGAGDGPVPADEPQLPHEEEQQ